MNKVSLFLTLLILVGHVSAQNTFTENFSSAVNWTQIGTNVAINNGRVEFTNLSFDGEQRRIYYSLNDTLDSTTTFTAEFEFTPTQVGRQGSSLYTGHNLFAFTAGTKEPYNNCMDIPCTGFPLGTQDGIVVNYIARNPSTDSIFFWLKLKDGISEYGANTRVFSNTLNSTFYIRLERLDCLSFRLSIFSDINKSIHLPGSPFTETFPTAATGFNTIQIGNVARGDRRRGLNGSIDNLDLRWQPIIDQFSIGNDTSICNGDSLVLDATMTNSTYLWNDGTSEPTLTAFNAGQYWVIVSNDCGTFSDTINVTQIDSLTVNLGDSIALCDNSFVSLDATNTTASYLWQDGSTSASFTTTEHGNYSVTVSNQCETKIDSVLVFKGNCDCFISIPNIFSPNNDGINDMLVPSFECNYLSFQLQIFNRWGEVVFTSSSPHYSWNGTVSGIDASNGVYVYLLTYESTIGVVEKQGGTISLIR